MALKNLDIVLAFAALMLVLSLLITTVVQAIISLTALRGINLLRGVGRLFLQLDPIFTDKIAHELSSKLLGHPAVARSFGRVTQAITKEEFLRIANDLVAHDRVQLSTDAKEALRTYLSKTVVALPKGQQIAIATAAKALPGEVAVSFHDAVERVAGSVQKAGVDVEDWFDTVLDRTRDSFLLHTRVITAVAAVVLAFGFHVDSLYLIHQLSANDEARATLVESVPAMTGTPPGSSPSVQELQKQLASTQLEIFAAGWTNVSWTGLTMTAIFLSLGAPFWYNARRNLSSLRPSIARVVDAKSGDGA